MPPASTGVFGLKLQAIAILDKHQRTEHKATVRSTEVAASNEQASSIDDSFRRHFIRGVLGSGALGAMQNLLSLLTAVVLARSLGTDGYGYYGFAIAAVSLAAIPIQLGLPTLLMREIAASHARRDWSAMRGMRKRATQFSLISSAFGVAVIGGGLILFDFDIAALDPVAFALALLLLPLWALRAMASSILSGLRLVLHAAWPGSLLQPLVFLAGLLVLIAWHKPLSPVMAVGANIFGSSAAFLAVTYLLILHWPKEASESNPIYRTGPWVKSLLPFAMLAGINVINQKTDTLMLGVMTSAKDVGIYNIALQGSMLVSFALTVFNAVLAPNVARLYAQGSVDKLQKLLTSSTAGISVFAGFTALILLFAGEWLLEHVFGKPYIQAYTPLIILLMGQLINAFMGSVGLFLSMTGHENDTLRAMTYSAIANIVLNILLIPRFGILGAAAATAFSVALWNIILGVRIYQRLKLVPGPLLVRSRLRQNSSM